MQGIDLERLQQQITETVARICENGCSLWRLLTELQRVGRDAETLLAQAEEGDRALIACSPGCGSCCVVNVDCLVPEAIAIADQIAAQPMREHARTRTRLEKLWQAIRGLDDEERRIAAKECAFLDARGWCSIYPVRPLLCRSITSTDVGRCKAALSDISLEERPPVLMHQFQQQLYQAIFSGFGDGLEQGGLDGRSFQLSGMVRFLLRHPEQKQRLLAGGRLCWDEVY
jgi:Fe-S-cluster containining protein